MSGATLVRSESGASGARARSGLLPAIVLVILSPLVIEVLYGSTPITKIWLVVPEFLVYGCGALIARTLVRRLGLGWGSLLLLGFAYSIAEECVILQTSLQPIPFTSTGSALGVDWVYLLEMLGYEPVWAILIPVALTELLFPAQRDDPWLGTRGLLVAAGLFVVGAIGAWYFWNTRGIQRFGSAGHQSPALEVIAALVLIVALVAIALGPWMRRRRAVIRDRRAPRPWLLGLAAFWFAVLWLAFLGGFAGGAFPLPTAIPLGFGVIWGGLGLLLVRRWSTASDFSDRHRMALVFGAVTGSWLEGTIAVLDQGPASLIAKFVLDLAGIVLLILLARRVKRRTLEQPSVRTEASNPAV